MEGPEKADGEACTKAGCGANQSQCGSVKAFSTCYTAETLHSLLDRDGGIWYTRSHLVQGLNINRIHTVYLTGEGSVGPSVPLAGLQERTRWISPILKRAGFEFHSQQSSI